MVSDSSDIEARLADNADRALLRALVAHPDATHLALSEATGFARNTVRARLARYARARVLRSFERRIDPGFLGYPLHAYATVTVKQRQLDAVGAALAGVPEVLEVYGLSGVTDLLVHIVARDAEDLYRVAGQILATEGVKRTNTGLVMREMVGYRVAQLMATGAG